MSDPYHVIVTLHRCDDDGDSHEWLWCLECDSGCCDTVDGRCGCCEEVAP